MFDVQGMESIATTMVLAGSSWLGGLAHGGAVALVAWCLAVAGLGISLAALRGLAIADRQERGALAERRVLRAGRLDRSMSGVPSL